MLLFMLVLSVVSTVTAVVAVRRTTQQVTPPSHGQWSPAAAAPGQNLDLYYRVKDLLETADQQVKEAREESARLQAQLQEVAVQRDMLAARLRSADDVLRAWTHPQMSFDRSNEIRYKAIDANGNIRIL